MENNMEEEKIKCILRTCKENGSYWPCLIPGFEKAIIGYEIGSYRLIYHIKKMEEIANKDKYISLAFEGDVSSYIWDYLTEAFEYKWGEENGPIFISDHKFY
jgi:hypothetical protein